MDLKPSSWNVSFHSKVANINILRRALTCAHKWRPSGRPHNDIMWMCVSYIISLPGLHHPQCKYIGLRSGYVQWHQIFRRVRMRRGEGGGQCWLRISGLFSIMSVQGLEDRAFARHHQHHLCSAHRGPIKGSVSSYGGAHPGVSNLSTWYHMTNYPWPDLQGLRPQCAYLPTGKQLNEYRYLWRLKNEISFPSLWYLLLLSAAKQSEAC